MPVDFGPIAPYLTNPLVLIGFVLMLIFGVYHALIRSGMMLHVTQQAGRKKVQQTLLHYGFVLSLVVIVLGFGYQFYKSHVDAGTDCRRQCDR